MDDSEAAAEAVRRQLTRIVDGPDTMLTGAVLVQPPPPKEHNRSSAPVFGTQFRLPKLAIIVIIYFCSQKTGRNTLQLVWLRKGHVYHFSIIGHHMALRGGGRLTPSHSHPPPFPLPHLFNSKPKLDSTPPENPQPLAPSPLLVQRNSS